MPLSATAQAAYSKLWQFVQEAASVKTDSGQYAYTSRDVVQAANAIYKEAGQALTFAESAGIPGLFSMARAQYRSADALFTADAMTSIDASMIAEWPTAAPLAVQAAQPQYMAKGEFTYTNAIGEVTTGWVTITGITQLPTTVGNLRLRLQGKAISSYSTPPDQNGTPKTDAEVMTAFGSFTSIQLYAV